MSNNETLVEKIIESFDTWKFKREQPFNYEKLKQVVQATVDSSKPIKFVTYWGKGNKDKAGEPEKQTLNFLQEFFGRIKTIYPTGVELLILLTDTHAELNGHSQESTKTYFDSVKDLAQNYEFKTAYLSELVSYDKDRLLPLVESLNIGDGLFEILLNSAQKHYTVSDDYSLAAKLYYLQNQLERKRIDDDYPDYIFLTFNGSKLNDLFPKNLPIFYMYSTKKGHSAKPWFEDELI